MTYDSPLHELVVRVAVTFGPLFGLVLVEKLRGRSVLGFRAFAWPFVFIGMVFYATVLCGVWSVRAWFAGVGYAAKRTEEILTPKR